MEKESLKRRILVADDFLMMRTMISEFLRKIGYSRVFEAVNGEDVMCQLEKADNENDPYEILILDWKMPKLDGFEVLKRCREGDKYSSLAILMVTAEIEKQQILNAIQVGATNYIMKPVTREQLETKLEVIEGWIGEQAA